MTAMSLKEFLHFCLELISNTRVTVLTSIPHFFLCHRKTDIDSEGV